MSKAVRFRNSDGEIKIGAMSDNGEAVREVGPAGPLGFVPDAEGWAAIQSAAGREYALSEITLLAPVRPAKIVAIGLNYRDHARESDLDIPGVPVVFAKFPSSITDPGAPIVIPREETRPDYEGEVAVVISRRTYRASREEARQAVGGITAVNDVSGRRAQLETPLRQFTLGKSFDTFTPLGPSVRPADGVDLAAIALRTTVSGQVMQESSTANLIFSIVELIEYCSKGMTLEPGDVIATGTPAGVGDSREPRRYLQDGDVVEVWVDGVGTLTNPVRREA